MDATFLSHLCAADAEVARVVDGALDGCDRFERAYAEMTSPEANASWKRLIAELRGEPSAEDAA